MKPKQDKKTEKLSAKVTDLFLPPPLEDEQTTRPKTVHDLLLPPPLDGSEDCEAQTIYPKETLGGQPPVPHFKDSKFPTIPGYKITGKLGRGGMGTVYLAVDDRLDRQVAIKIVTKQVSRQKNLVDRFASEVKSVAGLNHPNIAQLYEADMFAEQPYYVMEFVDGETLEDYVALSPPSPRASAELVKKIAETIEFCHQKNIIHRDLKPSNILLDQDRNPKVADFGLAKSLQSDHDATKTGEILGTPGYMAPEQASGVVKTIGPACDVYAIGAILYRMLTGRAPFYSPDPLKTVMMVLSDDPVAPKKLQSGLPKDLETICLKCLEKKATRRYHTAKELVDDLGRFLDGLPIHARPVSSIERVGKWARRKPAIASILFATAVMIPATIAGLAYHSNQLNKALKEKNAALEIADAELARSNKLADEGSDVSTWIIYNHFQALTGLGGSNQAQLELASRIQEYLDAATPHMPDEAKFRRRHGQAYSALAGVQGYPGRSNLGLTDSAMENYDRAITIFNETLEADPDDITTKKLLAQDLMNKSEMLFVLKGASEAEPSLKKVKKILEEIKESETESKEPNELCRLEISYLQQRVHIGLARHQFDEMLEYCDQIESLSQKIDVSEEQWQLEKENLEIWLSRSRSDAYLRKGDFKKAQLELVDAVDSAKKTYQAKPNDPRMANRYRGCLIPLGDLQVQLEQTDEALKTFLLAETVQQQAVDMNPDDVEAKQGFALVLIRKASLYEFMGEPELAIGASKKAVAIRREFVERDPDNATYRQGLGLDLATLGTALMRNSQFEQAEDILDEQHAILLAERKRAESFITASQALAQCKFNLGVINFQLWSLTETSADAETYQLALKYFDDAIEVYGEMNAKAPLDHFDTEFLAGIKNMRGLLLDTAKRLSEVPKDEGPM